MEAGRKAERDSASPLDVYADTDRQRDWDRNGKREEQEEGSRINAISVSRFLPQPSPRVPYAI